MVRLRFHILFSVVLLQHTWQTTSSTPEEAFLGYPLQIEEEPYIYLDSRAGAAYSPTEFKQSETRRRSTLDKNFARFGRTGGYGLVRSGLRRSEEVDDVPETIYMGAGDDNFGRNARSGEKNDQFIRFGRGSSDFVRFGRPAKDFVRFGRRVRSVKAQANDKSAKKVEQRRRKRALKEFVHKRADGTNFMRFGRRDGNDNFMRFGRQNATNMKLMEMQDRRRNHDLLLRMLANQLTRSYFIKNKYV